MDDLAAASEKLLAVHQGLQASQWQGRAPMMQLIYEANLSIDRIASKGAAAIMRARARKEGAGTVQAAEAGQASDEAAGELGTGQASREVR